MSNRPWPDSVDCVPLIIFLSLAYGLPLLGYWLLVLDIRRYLRSLRRALVVVAQSTTQRLPYWAARERPPCMQALDLTLPCTEEQVLAAYRERAKLLHPDHGGSLRHFLKLQKHFEQALYIVRHQNKTLAKRSRGSVEKAKVE